MTQSRCSINECSLSLQGSEFYGPLGFCKLSFRVGAPPTSYSKAEGLVSSQNPQASIVCLVESGMRLDGILQLFFLSCLCLFSKIRTLPGQGSSRASFVTTSLPHQSEGLPPLGCPRTSSEFLWAHPQSQLLHLIAHVLVTPSFVDKDSVAFIVVYTQMPSPALCT